VNTVVTCCETFPCSEDIPDTGDVPLVADMSSNYLSKPIDVKR
jgi:phosphoserine aminotransferase